MSADLSSATTKDAAADGKATTTGVDAYQQQGQIGEGTFGKVFKIRRVSDGEQLVWKELFYGNMSDREKQQLVSEVNILREFTHPNIVQYFDRIIDRLSKKIYIVMEYCAGGDLANVIKHTRRQRKYLDEDFIWKALAQMASALHTCHKKASKKILHRDLKPGNVFLDAQGNVKLGDFGLARILENSMDFAKTHVGTPYYMSPEQVTEKRYNEKSDIWSLGCLVYELASLMPPFRASNQLALAVKIQQGRFSPLPSKYSGELEKMVRLMLQLDPARRPSIEQICSVPLVARHLKKPKSKSKTKTKTKAEGAKTHKTRIKPQQHGKHTPDALLAWAASLEKKEASLHQKELELREWEQKLKVLEKSLRSHNQKPSQLEFGTPENQNNGKRANEQYEQRRLPKPTEEDDTAATEQTSPDCVDDRNRAPVLSTHHRHRRLASRNEYHRLKPRLFAYQQ